MVRTRSRLEACSLFPVTVVCGIDSLTDFFSSQKQFRKLHWEQPLSVSLPCVNVNVRCIQRGIYISSEESKEPYLTETDATVVLKKFQEAAVSQV